MSSVNALYTGRWSSQTRQPFPGVGWYDESRARAIYEKRSDLLTVVDAAERTDDGRPRQRWVLTFSVRGGVRCGFFRPSGTLWREIDYRPQDGRLRRATTCDYEYPDDDRFYLSGVESTRMLTGHFEPDGTVVVEQVEKGDHVGQRFHLTDSPVSGYWLDRPAFGDWTDLADPEYGVPSEDDVARHVARRLS
jgi:hypothetical protein